MLLLCNCRVYDVSHKYFVRMALLPSINSYLAQLLTVDNVQLNLTFSDDHINAIANHNGVLHAIPHTIARYPLI